LLHVVFPARKQTGASPFEMELHRTRPVVRYHGASDSSRDEEAVVLGKEKA
jgi:NCS1 family nucleobase:cation symporter-1